MGKIISHMQYMWQVLSAQDQRDQVHLDTPSRTFYSPVAMLEFQVWWKNWKINCNNAKYQLQFCSSVSAKYTSQKVLSITITLQTQQLKEVAIQLLPGQHYVNNIWTDPILWLFLHPQNLKCTNSWYHCFWFIHNHMVSKFSSACHASMIPKEEKQN